MEWHRLQPVGFGGGKHDLPHRLKQKLKKFLIVSF